MPPQPNVITIYQILSRLKIEAAFLRSELLSRSLLRFKFAWCDQQQSRLGWKRRNDSPAPSQAARARGPKGMRLAVLYLTVERWKRYFSSKLAHSKYRQHNYLY